MTQPSQIQKHIKLIKSVAGKFRIAGLEQDDLVQEASIAFLRAERTFNPDRGVQLVSYAYGVMLKELGNLCKHTMREKRDPSKAHSLDAPRHSNDERDMHEFIGEEDALDPVEVIDTGRQLQKLRQEIARLPARQKETMLRLLQDQNYAEQGAADGITRKGAHHHGVLAIKKLRERMGVAA